MQGETSTARGWIERRPFFTALLAALCPVALLLGALEYGRTPFHLMKFGSCTIACRGEPLERTALELTWLGGFGLLSVLSAICVFSGMWGVHAYTRRNWTPIALLVVVIVATVLARLQRGPFVEMLEAWGKACPTLAEHFLKPKTIGEAGASALGLVMCATVHFDRCTPRPHEVATRIVQLRWMLYLGAAVFVVALVVIRSVYAYVLDPASCPARWSDARAQEIVDAGTVYAGVTYSFLLAAFFVPPRVLLARWARSLVPPDKLENEKSEWLGIHDLAFTPSEGIRELATVLGPLLSALLPSILGAAS